MSIGEQLWRTPDGDRWFIVPVSEPARDGAFTVRALDGAESSVDPAWVARFEVSEAEGRAWAAEELGYSLEELRRRIDRKLAQGRAALDRARATPVTPDSRVTPDAAPALVALLKALPRAVAESLSGDTARVGGAAERLTQLQVRLNAAGIDVGEALGAFPDRLAGLRSDFERARSDAGRKSDDGS